VSKIQDISAFHGKAMLWVAGMLGILAYSFLGMYDIVYIPDWFFWLATLYGLGGYTWLLISGGK
jgi:hypothetical protein